MPESSVKLACRDVWKLFGPDSEGFLRRHREAGVNRELLAQHGLIGAVQAVDLDIRDGEIFIIMGLSGSGKSTLVRCLSRLIEPSHGQILFNGLDLLTASDREMIEIRRHKMGMVFQHFALLPHLDVLGNVGFPLEVQGVERSKRESRARQVIDLVGLTGRERYFPHELSGGQQQRVGIARSLAVEPELWFLDEPFSALDPLIRREMQDEFLRLQNVLQKTIVFITHDFDEAIRLADRIAIMKDGALVQVGTPEQLLLDPADEYVAEFTRHVSRAKVLSVRALMSPVLEGSHYAGQLQAHSSVAEVAERVEAAGSPFAVVDRDGNVIGQIDRQAVVDILVGRELRQ